MKFNFPVDKQLHCFISFAIAVIVATLLANALYQPIASPLTRSLVGYFAALFVSLAVGVYKEIRDSRQVGNHFCWYDLLADFIGAAIGSCIAFVTYLI